MASNAATTATPVRGFMADQAFFTRFALWLTIFILFAFGQFQLRGLTSGIGSPLYVHLHAAVMLGWLAMYVAQSWLVSAGQIAIHRKTGWIALALAAAVVVAGISAGINAVDTGRVPPFFSNSFFLALTFVGVATFTVVVALAVIRRREVQWHRRLMVGSGILITEPAFGRLVPVPLVGQSIGELIILGLQLALVGILARHDRKVLGSVHPATLVIALALVVHHLGLELVQRVPAFAAFAQSIAAG